MPSTLSSPSSPSLSALAVSILMLAVPMAQAAQPGDRDIGFGNGDGLVTLDLADATSDNATIDVIDSRVLPDGRIIILGRTNTGGETPANWRGFLLRHHADGSVDSSFGTDGITLLPGARGSSPFHILLDDVGRILVSAGWTTMDVFPSYGGSPSQAVVFRFNSNGRLDLSWGEGGVLTPPLSNVVYSSFKQQVGLAALPGNRYAMSYRINDNSMGVMVVNAFGQRVNDFGTNGVSIPPLPTGIAINHFKLLGLNDGRIVLYGSSQLGNGRAFYGRLTASGAWDPTVSGGKGYTLTEFGTHSTLLATDSTLTDAVDMGDGRIAFSGYWNFPSAKTKYQATVAMYTAQGVLDTSFGSSTGGDLRLGYTNTIITSGYDWAYSIARLGSGELIVGGFADVDGTFTARLNALGDTVVWRTVQSGSSVETSARLVPDGTLITLGRDNGTGEYRIRRQSVTNGSLVTSFGNGGVVLRAVKRSEMRAQSLSQAADGSITIAGMSEYGIPGSSAPRSVSRARNLSADGLASLTALTVQDALANNERIYQVIRDAEGGLVALVYVPTSGTPTTMRLARFHANGELDLSFGTNGFTPLLGQTAPITAPRFVPVTRMLTRQNSGRLLLTVSRSVGNDRFSEIHAYTPSGAPDTAFGDSGVADLTAAFADGVGSIFALSDDDADGLLVIGRPVKFSIESRRLVRLHANGSINTTWGSSGLFTYPTTNGAINPERLHDAAMDSQGRIVAVGTTYADKGIAVRFTSTGAVDTSFDGDGRRIFNWSSRYDSIDSVVIQHDDKVVVIGARDRRSFPDLVIERLLDNGGTDPSFGISGQVIESRARSADSLLTADGRLLVLASFDGEAAIYAYHTEANNDPIGIISSAGQIVVDEGGTTSIPIRLASQPTAPVTVTASLLSGADPSLSFASATSVVFTPENWSTNQLLSLSAANDPDTNDGSAVLRLSGSGLVAVERPILVVDNDVFTVAMVVSASDLVIPEGLSNSFTVRLNSAPAANVTIAVGLTQVTDVTKFTITSGSSLVFTTANWNTPQTVTVSSPVDANAVNEIGGVSLTGSNITSVFVSLQQADAQSGVNTPPSISSLADVSIVVGTVIDPVALTIGDAQTPAADLVLSAESSNIALVPVSAMVFGGSGSARTLTITPTPGLNGSALLTIVVSDGALTAQSSFTLTVTPTQIPRLVRFVIALQGAGMAGIVIERSDGEVLVTRHDGSADAVDASPDSVGTPASFPASDAGINQIFRFMQSLGDG